MVSKSVFALDTGAISLVLTTDTNGAWAECNSTRRVWKCDEYDPNSYCGCTVSGHLTNGGGECLIFPEMTFVSEYVSVGAAIDMKDYFCEDGG